MIAVENHERWINPQAKSSAYSPLFNCLSDKGPTPSVGGTRSVLGYLPCHYFDYVSGTSTGGLIAIMLGRLRRSVDEAIKEYKDLGATVFGKASTPLNRLLTNNDSTDRKQIFEDRFDSLPPTRLPSPQERVNEFKSDYTRCRTIVCSTKSSEDRGFQTPSLICSYDRRTSCTSGTQVEKKSSHSDFSTIGQVAWATSIAPLYLKSIHMFEAPRYHALTVVNNPSWEVLNEVSLLAKESHDAIDLFLSIGAGSGKDSKSRIRFGSGSLREDPAEISELVHNKVDLKSKVQDFDYHRFNVKEGLQRVRMDEWRPKLGGHITLGKIERATEIYLKQEDVRALIQRYAVYLVEKRTQRAQTMRWERFATGTRYRCPLTNDCPTPKAKFNTRNDLMDHLRIKHNEAPPDADHYQHIQELLNQGRTNRE